MRSLFPPTPTMRYERMHLAGMAAVISAVVGLAFLGMTLQPATFVTIQLLLTEPRKWQQAASLGMLAGLCLSLAISFTFSALIKAHVPNMERYMPFYVVGHWLALRMLYLAGAFAVGFAVVQGLAVAG